MTTNNIATPTDPETAYEQVRDIDRAVLKFVKAGVNSLRKINEETHDEVDGRQIGHSFTKLERLGLITVETPDGYTESVIDGQRRVHRKSRRAALTDRGLQYFEWADDREQRRKYEEMSWSELTEQVQENRELAEALDRRFEQFRRQMVQELEALRDEVEEDS